MTPIVPANVPPAIELRDPRAELKRYVRLAAIVMATLVIGVGGMATFVQLTSAVAAFGDVAVASKIKMIAHPTGGVIASIEVHDGQRVRKGQVLMRFDTTVSSVNADLSGKSLEQLLAAQGRLTAERDGLSTITFPAALTTNPTPSARATMAEEQRLFVLRRQTVAAQRQALQERIAQANQQIAGYETQIDASHQQSVLIGPELDGLRKLYAKQLTTIGRMNELERTAVSLTANAAQLRTNIAQLRAQISEIHEQMIQLDQDTRSRAGSDLADMLSKISDQTMRKTEAGNQFDKSTVVAPQAGVVDKLAYHTIGGVVPPAQTIMEIVPDSDRMTVEAKISPTDVDQVHADQPADLRFSAFNVRTTPEIAGTVRRVSADRVSDEKTGTSYYTVLIDIKPGEMAKLQGLKLVPGMPVEAYIRTGSRSMISYIFKPFSDQLNRAFRES